MLIGLTSFSQLDLARIELINIPKRGVEEFNYNRVRAMFNVPIKTGEDRYLFVGADYSLIDIDPIDDLDFETENLEDFQIFELNLGYTYKMKNGWRVIANIKPGLTTNSGRDLQVFKEIKLSGGLLFYIDKKKETRYTLLWGVVYSAFRGVPYPLPVVKYHRIINEHWSYDIGIPKMNLEYTFNTKHALKTYVAFDGFNSELQRNIVIANENVEKIQLRIILAGLKYDYTIADHFEWYASLGFIFDSTIRLKDDKRRDVLQLPSKNNLYLRTGFRIKL